MRRADLPESHRDHRVRTALSEYESFDSLMEQTAIKVYQETGFDVAQAQVREELRFK
jgi:hypothetical protein